MANETDLILNVIERTTGNALGDGARDLDRLAGSADDADGSMRGLGQGTGFVDSEIVRLRGHIRELGAEIDRTGNTSLFKDLRADESSLRKFQNLAKTLRPVGESGGREFNRGFLSTIGDLGSNLRGAMIPVAIGAAVVLAPVLGAMVAGAVVGAVGVGGIAGGIAMAARDPAVQREAERFGNDIADEFFAGGDAFVEPIVESLDILRDGFRNLNLDEALAPLADTLPALAEGLSGFALKAMPGLERAFTAAGPAIELFAELLPEVGENFGNMFATIAESEGALTGVRTLMGALNVTMIATGNTIDWLATRWDDIVQGLAAYSGAVEDILPGRAGDFFATINDGAEQLAGNGPKVAGAWAPIPGRFNMVIESTDGVSASFDRQMTAANASFAAISKLSAAYDDVIGRQQDVVGATIDFEQALDDLTASVDENGTSLNLNTQKGRDNMKVVQEGIGAARRMRDATFEQTGSMAEANRVYDAAIRKLEGVASKAGISAARLREMAGTYNVRVNVRTFYTSTGVRPPLANIQTGAIASAFADGGWVSGPPGKPQVAIVHGGEFVLSRDMLKGAATPSRTPMPAMAGGGGTTRHEFVVNTAGSSADNLLGELIKKYVYYNGGNVQTALGTGP